MRINIYIRYIGIILGLLCCLFQQKIFAQKSPYKLKTIVVDAGHGGPDNGAQGAYSNEADLTLAMALKLGKLLEEKLPECKIVYTRKDHNLPGNLQDHNAANRLRAKIANSAKGDLFIAIHVDDAPPKYERRIAGYRTETYYVTVKKGKKKKRVAKQREVPIIEHIKLPGTVKGSTTYVWASNKNDQKIKSIGEEEAETYTERADSSFQYINTPEARIMASLRTEKYFARSVLVGDMVQEELAKAGRVVLGTKQRNWAGIWVLQATAMPSILVETGYICTSEEEKYLNSEEGQDEIVNCIANAVLRYKKSIESGKPIPEPVPEEEEEKIANEK